MTNFSKYSMSVLVMSLLVGCGSSGGGSSFTDGGEQVVSRFDGTWTEGCVTSFDNESFYSVVIIDGDELIDSYNEYFTDDCSGEVSFYQTTTFDLRYGNLVPSASSICGNTQEFDSIATSLVIDGFEENIEQSIEYDLICTSPNGDYMYMGDFDFGDGQTPENRPFIIDDDVFYFRQ